MPSKSSFLDTARRVVRTEAAALGTLANALGPEVETAIQMILDAPGRVIISGMGKSGHIARKIAATLASTGTPAHFVHPAEASHGDLGMMTRHDVVICLSYSGETPELADMIAYTRRFNIPLIGIARARDSSLLKQADVAIVLPKVEEACGTGIVPTSSTTMSLALGDAIAVALMEHRQFTAENFRDFHPGGQLGAKLALVRDLMHDASQLPLVSRASKMDQTLLEISEKGFGVAGVISDERALIGIVTDGDLRRNLDGLLDRITQDVMTKNPATISDHAMAEEALFEMNERKITSLFVVDDLHRPIGLIHVHDCLRAGLG